LELLYQLPHALLHLINRTDMGKRAAADLAARVMRKVFGAEPMPTMKTRERPRMAAMVSNSSCSLPISPSVRNTTWRRYCESGPRRPDGAAFRGGPTSVPPLA